MTGQPRLMAKKWYDTDILKERLEEYIEAEKDIDNQIERLEHLNSKLEGLGAQVLTDMPRSPSTTTDKMGEMYSRIEELDSVIRGMIKDHDEEKKWIEFILRHVRKANERAVIRMKYIDQEAWKPITEMLFGALEDYEEKYESYLRRAHFIHGSALVSMAEFIELSGDQNMAAYIAEKQQPYI